MDGERDIGLADLSGPQRDVYYALLLLQAELGVRVKTSRVLEHDLVAHIPRATFYRALSSSTTEVSSRNALNQKTLFASRNSALRSAH